MTTFPFAPATGFIPLWGVITLLIGLASIALNIVFALAVWNDANAAVQTGRGTFLVPPLWWAIAVGLGGLVAVGIYWAIHHSALRPNLVGKPESPRDGGLG